MSMYRFLVPFEDVLDLDGVGPLFAGQPPGFVTFYKAEVGRPGLLFNTYPCRKLVNHDHDSVGSADTH